jgi:hypothetical protein
MLSRVIHIPSKQELYFLYGDTIKVGDWVYNLISKEIYEITDGNTIVDYETKIVASTDPDLNLPKPKSSFVKFYCEEYSLGNYIESVIIDSIEDGSIRTAKVKFVTEGNTTTGRFELPKSIPIVDPKTNTITVSYTKRFTF